MISERKLNALRYIRVKNIRYLGKEPVYNMTVEDHHNFMIHGGAILKNCDALRYYCVSRPVPAKAPERELTDGERLKEIKKKAIYAASRNGRSRRF